MNLKVVFDRHMLGTIAVSELSEVGACFLGIDPTVSIRGQPVDDEHDVFFFSALRPPRYAGH